jgi:hypothetical protein
MSNESERDNSNTTLSVKITRGLRDSSRKNAIKVDLTLSQLVRKLLREYDEKQKLTENNKEIRHGSN